jgi:chromosome segregation ATPase
MLQKLEADIRGHIRLEHEMKIHLDYLEGRVEELENTNLKLNSDKKSLSKKIKEIEDKLRTAGEEAEKVERRHKEALDKLEKEIREVRLAAARQKQESQIMASTVEYNGEQSTAHDQYKKIHSQAPNSG